MLLLPLFFMILIIAHHHDREAVWLHRFLCEKAGLPAKLLIAETLGLDYQISLELSNTAAAKCSIRWLDTGETVLNTDVTWLINRLTYVDAVLWNRTSSAEKQYANNELNAFFAAFIFAFDCEITNPVCNGSLHQSQFVSNWIAHFKKNGINASQSLLKNRFCNAEVLASPQTHRFLYCKNSMYQPEQVSDAVLKRVLPIIQPQKPPEMLEFGFECAENSSQIKLSYVSNTPCFSAYGKPVITSIIKLHKKSNYDTVIRNPERKSHATFDQSLYRHELAALRIQPA